MMPLDPKAAAGTVSALLREVQKLDQKAEARASVFSARAGNTRFARNEVTTSAETDEAEVSLFVQLGRRSAVATTNQLEPEALRALAARTFALARIAPEDPEAMPVLGPVTPLPGAASFDAAAVKLDAAARAEMARVSIAAAKKRDLVIAGFAEHVNGTQALATTAGLNVQNTVSVVGLSMTARTADGSGSGWSSGSARGPSAIDAAKLAEVACEKAALSKAPKKLEPGRYTVLLEPAAAATMLRWLVEALDARSADEGRSFFSKKGGGSRLGEKLFNERITLSSNPAATETAGWTVDPEGLALPPITWVENGVVKALQRSRFWAQKTGAKPTGEYGGYSLKAGSETFDAMLSGIERGVLITRFWYTNSVDPQTMTITGLTRDGTFLIEKGQLVGAVNNFRFNQSVAQALANCDALSVDAPTVGSPENRCPAMRTHEFNLATVSEAV
ncbi:MAG: TldD/PmbA family protein [Myxococcaceae bacterium]|nr:TldD/PmbA family protein [Myxococcaceae bacterium]